VSLGVFHRRSDLYGAFVWVRKPLHRPCHAGSDHSDFVIPIYTTPFSKHSEKTDELRKEAERHKVRVHL
jgi:hypothetical protein